MRPGAEAAREAGELAGAVIVVSDDVAHGRDDDRAGPVAVSELAAHGVRASLQVVGDDVTAIAEAVRGAGAAGARVVMTCGGTGVGPTDVTVDAVRPLLAREMPGIVEEIRRRGSARTPVALVSGEVAGVMTTGVARPVVVLTAPGSRGGVRDAVGVIGPLLRYVVGQLDGAGHSPG